MRWRTLLAVTVSLSVLAACSDDGDTTTQDTTTTAAEVTTTETTERTTTTSEAPVAADVQVTLVDAGAEPRQELRYDPEVGTVDAITQRNELTLVQEIDGQRQEVPVPVTSIDVDQEVVGATDGLFTVEGTYGEARVEGDDAAAAETRRLLEQISGARLITEMDDNGAIVTTRLEGMEQTGNPVFDQLTTSLVDQAASLAFPFPDEAVGIGARWTIETDVEVSGLPIAASYVVTLTELDGDQVAADVEARVGFVPGPVVVQGTSAEVVGGELSGSGTVSWDLARGLVPRTALDMSGTVTIDVQGTRLVQQQTQRASVVARS